MAGSSFGTLFCMTTWGETHGKGVGVVVDGCPAGLSLCEEDIQKYLNRRKPGQSKYTTKRKEDDKVEILSGVFEGKTTGTPISMAVFNKDQHSKDYSAIKDIYRPGHADYTFDKKYGFRDYRGGGRSSGRETTARVAAGAVAAKVLKELGIEVFAYTKAIGPVQIDENRFLIFYQDEFDCRLTVWPGYGSVWGSLSYSGKRLVSLSSDKIWLGNWRVYSIKENCLIETLKPFQDYYHTKIT